MVFSAFPWMAVSDAAGRANASNCRPLKRTETDGNNRIKIELFLYPDVSNGFQRVSVDGSWLLSPVQISRLTLGRSPTLRIRPTLSPDTRR